DRVRLTERAAVVEDECRNAKRRVELAEQLGAVRAVDDRHADVPVLEPQMREQESHLVAVARDRRVVEKHAANASPYDRHPWKRRCKPGSLSTDETCPGDTVETRIRSSSRR